jgi:hypothetical protein
MGGAWGSSKSQNEADFSGWGRSVKVKVPPIHSEGRTHRLFGGHSPGYTPFSQEPLDLADDPKWSFYLPLPLRGR